MSDLLDAPGTGAPRAGIVQPMSWDEFWARVVRSVSRVSGDGPIDLAEVEAAAEWTANRAALSPGRAADDEDEEDEEDEEADEEEEDEDDDLGDDDELDDLDDLDEEEEDEELDDEEEDEDFDDDLEDEDFDDDLVDLDDEYDTEDEERHRGGSDYEPD